MSTDRVAQLEERLAVLERAILEMRRPHGDALDRQHLVVLGDAMGGATFDAAQLLRRARVVPALGAALALVDNRRQAGKWLARLARLTDGPIRLVRVGQRGGAWRWRVEVVSEV